MQSPVDPVFLATALGDRRDADISLNLGGTPITLALFTEGDEQSGGEVCTGTRQRAKQGVVGQGLADGRDLDIEAVDCPQRHAQLFDEGEHQELIGPDHGQVVGQRGGAFDGVNALIDARLRAHVVVMKERQQRSPAGALELFERRPASEEVAEQQRVTVLKPSEDIGEILFQRINEATANAVLVPHQPAALFDQRNSMRMGPLCGVSGLSLAR